MEDHAGQLPRRRPSGGHLHTAAVAERQRTCGDRHPHHLQLSLPLEDGAYHFGFAYTGENVVSSENGALVIAPASDNNSAQPLPKYNADGERYTYTLQETSITLKYGVNPNDPGDYSEVYLEPGD